MRAITHTLPPKGRLAAKFELYLRRSPQRRENIVLSDSTEATQEANIKSLKRLASLGPNQQVSPKGESW